MITAPYEKDVDTDLMTRKVIESVQETIEEKEDDFLLPIVGPTGTGKSHLSMHLVELYDPIGCSIDYIGLDHKSHAVALQKAKEKTLPRYCVHDEANINRQAHATNYNKDIIDLYLAIRGLQIFHIWNNPTATLFPRVFIEERIKGMIYIFTKDKDRPRLFYYFTKSNMLKMYDECKGVLNHRNIKKLAKKYALYRGWFREYKGKLLKDYQEKKISRMDTKVEDFFDKYGRDDMLNTSEVARELGVVPSTIRVWSEEMGGLLIPDVDYTVTAAGHKRFNVLAVDKIKDYASSRKIKSRNRSQDALYIDTRKNVNSVDSESTEVEG